MLLSRRFPFWDIERTFEEMNRVFDALGAPLGLRSMPRGAFPAINLYDHEDELVLTAEVPGVNAKDLELSVVDNSVTLSGKREEPAEDTARYYRRERPTGTFTRTITLSEKVDRDKVKAECRDGVLTVHLPKLESAKPKAIQIQSA